MFASRRVLTVMLIAMLASGVLSAPACRHSHVMSEHSLLPVKTAKHSHGAGHQHSHHHHHRGVHRHESGSRHVLSDPAVEHLHVMWFGIGLTIPISPDAPSPYTNTTAEWVPLVGEMFSLENVGANGLGLDSQLVTAAAFSMTPPRAEPFVPPKISRLYDMARRERSGVLII